MNSRMKLVAAVLVACACLVAVLAASLTVLGSGLEGQERAVIEAILEEPAGTKLYLMAPVEVVTGQKPRRRGRC